KEGQEIPLVRNGRVLEAKIGKLAFPAAMQVRLSFQPDAPEHLFDFIFEKFSKDLPAPVVTTTNAAPGAAASGTSAGSPPGAGAAGASTPTSGAPSPNPSASVAPTSGAPIGETA